MTTTTVCRKSETRRYDRNAENRADNDILYYYYFYWNTSGVLFFYCFRPRRDRKSPDRFSITCLFGGEGKVAGPRVYTRRAQCIRISSNRTDNIIVPHMCSVRAYIITGEIVFGVHRHRMCRTGARNSVRLWYGRIEIRFVRQVLYIIILCTLYAYIPTWCGRMQRDLKIFFMRAMQCGEKKNDTTHNGNSRNIYSR